MNGYILYYCCYSVFWGCLKHLIFIDVSAVCPICVTHCTCSQDATSIGPFSTRIINQIPSLFRYVWDVRITGYKGKTALLLVLSLSCSLSWLFYLSWIKWHIYKIQRNPALSPRWLHIFFGNFPKVFWMGSTSYLSCLWGSYWISCL